MYTYTCTQSQKDSWKNRDFFNDFKDVSVFDDLIWQGRLFQTDGASRLKLGHDHHCAVNKGKAQVLLNLPHSQQRVVSTMTQQSRNHLNYTVLFITSQ